MGKNCSKQQRSLTIVTRTAWNAMQCSIFATDFMVSSNLISHREGGIYPNEPCFQNRYHEDESPVFYDGTHCRRRLCLSAQRRSICGAYRLFKRLTTVFLKDQLSNLFLGLHQGKDWSFSFPIYNKV